VLDRAIMYILLIIEQDGDVLPEKKLGIILNADKKLVSPA
jgi:hypothetical protein